MAKFISNKFFPIIKELYLTEINFGANPFSKREWKNYVILSCSLFKIKSLIFPEQVSSIGIFPPGFVTFVLAP